MSQTNESDIGYEGSYFKAFVNKKEMLEVQTVGSDNFIVQMTLIDNGDWASHYIDKMKDELDEIAEIFVNTKSKYSLNDMFDIDFKKSLDELTIRRGK